MGEGHEIIYKSAREALINRWSQLQVLKDGGINVSSLEEDAYRSLELLVELEDSKKLNALRKELQCLGK